MDKTPPRALVVTLDTAVNGESRAPGDVLLLPEQISEDTARALMRMARPRVEPASPDQTRKQLTAFNKAQAARDAAEAEARELAQAQAQAAADEQAAAAKSADQLLADATAEAEQIIAGAKAEADKITAAAKKAAGSK